MSRLAVTLLLLAAASAARAKEEPVSLWPFFVWDRSPERTEIDILWPGYEYTREGEESRRLHVLYPLTGFTRFGEERASWILPLLFWGQTAPGHRYAMLLPLAGTLPDRGIHWLANLVYAEDGENEFYGALPLWFQQWPGMWGVGIPPLFFRMTDGKIDHAVLFPLVWWNAPDRWGLFPLLWRDGDWWASFPLWGGHTRSRGNSYFLFPLRLHTVDIDIETEHFLWPFIAVGVDTYGYRFRLWPLIGLRRQRWAHGALPRWHTTYALWPLIWNHRDWDRHGDLMNSHFVVAPFVFSFGKTVEGGFERTTVIPPLLTWWSAGEGDLRQLAVLFPLYLQTDQPAVERRTWRVLWELAVGRHSRPESEVRVLRGLFHRRREGQRVEGSVFPLLTWERDPEADTAEFALMWRFVEYSREGDERGLRLFFLPWRIPL